MRVPRLSPWLVVLTLVAAGAAAAAGYGLTAPKRYLATAQLLVSPVPASDTTFVGFDVLRDTEGKQTAAATAAVLVRSPQVADTVRAQLGLRTARGALLDEVDAWVVDASDVVDVGVTDTSARAAAQLANTFVDALVAMRTTAFQNQLAATIHQDAQLLASSGSGPQAVALARRLAVLRGLLGQPDPTLRRASTATAPVRASSPGVWELVGIGAACGLGAGLLVLLALALRRRPRGRPLLPPLGGPPGEDAVAEALVDRLERRLAARESALAARERDLQARIVELRGLEAGRPPGELDLARRERELEERVAAVTRRELALARAAARRTAERPAADGRGSYNLAALERLVEANGTAPPERLDEWRSYLFFLRDHAGADGNLPASFDGLVEQTFAELLDSGFPPPHGA